MEWIVVLFVVAVVIAVLFVKGRNQYSYRIKGPLFSPAERSFLGVIDAAVSDTYRVFGKVRVADVLSPQKGMSRKHWQIAFNKISAKHFDYVLCCKDTLKIIAVIELDDKSHNKAASKNRDKLLKEACESASLTLVRFPAKASYSIAEVRQSVADAINPPIEESR